MQLMLTIEKNVFNILMYIIIMVGGLVAIGVDMLGTLVNPVVYWHNLAILSGVMAAGALCHFFHHRSVAYLAKDENSEFMAYEHDLKKHWINKRVVLAMNFVILAILVGEMVRSLSKIELEGSSPSLQIYACASLVFFFMSFLVFVAAQKIATDGWDSDKQSRPGIAM